MKKLTSYDNDNDDDDLFPTMTITITMTSLHNDDSDNDDDNNNDNEDNNYEKSTEFQGLSCLATSSRIRYKGIFHHFRYALF